MSLLSFSLPLSPSCKCVLCLCRSLIFCFLFSFHPSVYLPHSSSLSLFTLSNLASVLSWYIGVLSIPGLVSLFAAPESKCRSVCQCINLGRVLKLRWVVLLVVYCVITPAGAAPASLESCFVKQCHDVISRGRSTVNVTVYCRRISLECPDFTYEKVVSKQHTQYLKHNFLFL